LTRRRRQSGGLPVAVESKEAVALLKSVVLARRFIFWIANWAKVWFDQSHKYL